MQIVYVDEQNLASLQQIAPSVAMALGYFDGVHRGHQYVIEQAKKQADKKQLALAVLSFFPHSKSVLIPNCEVAYIDPIKQKAEKLEKIGVEIFYVVQFTKELANLSPIKFLDEYVVGLQAKEVICGFDYTFGHKASGTVHTLAEYAASQRIGCTVVEEFVWQEEKISSTRIRQYLQAGKVQELPQLIGSYYKIEYCLKNGVLPYYSLPKKGIYQVLVNTGQELIPCLATVLCKKKIQFHCYGYTFPSVVTVQWIDDSYANQSFAYKG